MKEQSKASRKHGIGYWLRGMVLLVLILFVGIWITGLLVKSDLAGKYPPQGQLVDVGEYHMHINCTGKGSPTVILEAGLDDFSIFWSHVQPEVAQFTRVCSYDRAGYGWSDPSPYPRNSGTMVAELHELLVNANVLNPYVVVGHSFGGALVRLYAHNYPGEVLGMVLVDSVHDELFTRVPGWRIPIEKKLGLYRMLNPLSKLGFLAFTPGSIPNRGMPDEVLAQYRAIVVSSDYFQTGVAENAAFADNLSEIHAAHIDLGDLPLIVISDALWDPFSGLAEVSPSEAEQARKAWQEMQSELLALSTRSKQVIAEQSGHHIQFDQPELVIEAIRELVGAE